MDSNLIKNYAIKVLAEYTKNLDEFELFEVESPVFELVRMVDIGYSLDYIEDCVSGNKKFYKGMPFRHTMKRIREIYSATSQSKSWRVG